MRTPFVFTAVAVTALAGCATAPADPVNEKLDPNTAITVTVITQPVELVAESPRGSSTDPFAYIAPFETNKMGERALFLWVSAPQYNGPIEQPKLLCDGQPVGLQPVSGDFTQFNLSQPPYQVPAPWSGQWYFRLSDDALKCLAGAQGVALETHRTQAGDSERFSAPRKSMASLEAFSRRY